MVEGAEQQPVVEVGLAPEQPGDEMGNLAPARRRRAAGPGAPAIAERDRTALSPVEQPLGPAQIELLAGSAEDDRDDLRVARQAAGRRGADRSVDAVDPGGTDAAEERVVIFNTGSGIKYLDCYDE